VPIETTMDNDMNENVEKLIPFLQHKRDCAYNNCQQYADTPETKFDSKKVDCDCGLVKVWEQVQNDE